MTPGSDKGPRCSRPGRPDAHCSPSQQLALAARALAPGGARAALRDQVLSTRPENAARAERIARDPSAWQIAGGHRGRGHDRRDGRDHRVCRRDLRRAPASAGRRAGAPALDLLASLRRGVADAAPADATGFFRASPAFAGAVTPARPFGGGARASRLCRPPTEDPFRLHRGRARPLRLVRRRGILRRRHHDELSVGGGRRARRRLRRPAENEGLRRPHSRPPRLPPGIGTGRALQLRQFIVAGSARFSGAEAASA